MVFSTNKNPDSDDTSHDYYKIWLILSFERSFVEDAKDVNLIHKITTNDELSGLLNLALVGLRQLEKDGGFINIPVKDIKTGYERKSNTVNAFLKYECSTNLQAPDYVVPSRKVYEEYLYTKKRKTS